MNKKVIILTVLTVLTLFVLTACGSASPDGPQLQRLSARIAGRQRTGRHAKRRNGHILRHVYHR